MLEELSFLLSLGPGNTVITVLVPQLLCHAQTLTKPQTLSFQEEMDFFPASISYW